MPFAEMYNTKQEERAIIVSLSIAGGDDDAQIRLEELRELASTAGAIVIGEYQQSRRAADTATYIGTGKTEELAAEVKASRADIVIFDDELSPTQQRNLQSALETIVLDRTQLILDIFAQHARTREGRLQVELAQLIYLLPRLSAQYTKFERQQGGIGGRGPGETKLETDRRKVRDRINDLGREIDEIKEQRKQQRVFRRRMPFPTCALVGYTSAGKSTLLNLLSGADVFADARLFSTLDPTTRRVVLPEGWSVLMTDTVGFIKHLPHLLIASFRATLEEVLEADFLIHVVDASHAEFARQMSAVAEVLDEIGVHQRPVITVYNKADLVSDKMLLAELVERTPNSCAISAGARQGISYLTECLTKTIRSLLVPIQVAIPYDRSELVALCYENGKVYDVSYEPESIHITADVTKDLAGKLEQFVINADNAFYSALSNPSKLALDAGIDF
jgi:GTP-binding protein HflX